MGREFRTFRKLHAPRVGSVFEVDVNVFEQVVEAEGLQIGTLAEQRGCASARFECVVERA